MIHGGNEKVPWIFSPKALDFLKDCAVVHRDVKPGSGKGVMKDGGERVVMVI